MAKQLIISGDVQGVGYRWFVRQKARELGLTGSVQNKGKAVEVIVSGEPENVELFIEACREGPPAAQVDDVQVMEVEPGKDLCEFKILA